MPSTIDASQLGLGNSVRVPTFAPAYVGWDGPDSLCVGLSLLFRLPHLPFLAGEQNHFVLGRHVHRSNRTVVLERYGQKPVHDPGSSQICFPRRLGASPGLKLLGSGLLSPRKHLLIIQGLPPWCLRFTKRRQACESHKNQGTTSVVSEIRWTNVALQSLRENAVFEEGHDFSRIRNTMDNRRA